MRYLQAIYKIIQLNTSHANKSQGSRRQAFWPWFFWLVNFEAYCLFFFSKPLEIFWWNINLVYFLKAYSLSSICTIWFEMPHLGKLQEKFIKWERWTLGDIICIKIKVKSLINSPFKINPYCIVKNQCQLVSLYDFAFRDLYYAKYLGDGCNANMWMRSLSPNCCTMVENGRCGKQIKRNI